MVTLNRSTNIFGRNHPKCFWLRLADENYWAVTLSNSRKSLFRSFFLGCRFRNQPNLVILKIYNSFSNQSFKLGFKFGAHAVFKFNLYAFFWVYVCMFIQLWFIYSQLLWHLVFFAEADKKNHRYASERHSAFADRQDEFRKLRLLKQYCVLWFRIGQYEIGITRSFAWKE